ncbi:MAG: hypothetical protein COV31_00525 [Candidatus Yanofskybacteria bacterium CG10_big_fil_rev_8_21_14_0_10_46_23]|uniref:Sortase n=1 Tax=Candidatus Yanofskybacteria bacterium CG10_big_fil_rev_8_21_14_0_10_46_23 TaxID=1975098 RepID=A0A2H0R528_9BACT|nr:MAG: hypothetical protein COV31_00525 [Candidatus Yanofskybacteria bacterium CG10_big_fil_rev_8_21_14_0_10_46_23]
MKQFVISFVGIFLVLFLLLNFRFVTSQTSFWLENNSNPVVGLLGQGARGETGSYQLLPVAKSKFYEPDNTASSLYLEIPAIGVTAPIVFEESLNSEVIINRLQEGVVRYAASPVPGEKGTSVILGHSSAFPWYKGKYGSVFALLGKLEIGDKFYIHKDGDVLTYQVKDKIVFNPLSTDERVSQFEQTDDSAVVLVSCWPIGTSFKRQAVKAELI